MEGAIITLRLEEGEFECDMEVSPNTPCKELANQIAEILRHFNPLAANRLGAKPYLKTTNGERLLDGVGLGRQGLWDGSIIILSNEE